MSFILLSLSTLTVVVSCGLAVLSWLAAEHMAVEFGDNLRASVHPFGD